MAGDGGATVGDLIRDELDLIGWSGSASHIRNVAGQLDRRDAGAVDYLVARDAAGRPIAKGAVDYEENPGAGTITQLATRTDLEGRGLAQAIIREAEQRIRRRGLTLAVLSVEPENERARRLYEYLGYEPTGERETGWEHDLEDGTTGWYSTIVVDMRKNLDPAGADPNPYELPDERVTQAWERLLGEYLIVEELEPDLAKRIRADSPKTFAELGSATAPISRLLTPDGTRCVAIDLNPPDGAFRPTVCADLRNVPLPTRSFDAVSAVNCLYFVANPSDGIAEAARLLKPGGLLLAGAPSRYHDPELQDVLPDWGQPSPFDAEDAAAIVSTVFDHVEVEWWEAPAYLLPDTDAVVDYLVAFKVPDPERRAKTINTPTHVTKSGVNIWARR